MITNKVAVNLNMFVTLVKDVIVSNLNITLIVIVY